MAGTEAVIGSLVVRIGGDVKGLVDATTRAEGSMKSLGNISEKMAKAITGAIVAATVAVAALTAQSQKTIDSQLKLAERMQASVASVQALAYAGDLAGVGMEAMTKAADMMNRKIGEAIRDSVSPAADAFRRLGLNVRELSQMDADERMAKIADRIKALGLNGAQAADALRQIGIRSAEMLNLMQQGGDAIRNARKDMDDFGVTVSNLDAKKVEIANDAMTTMSYVLKGIGNQVAVAVAPAIQAVAEYFSDAARETKGFKGAIENAVDITVMGFARMIREVQTFRIQIDEAVADFINGFDAVAAFIPSVISRITGLSMDSLGFHKIEHEFGKLRQKIGEPASMEAWSAWWNELKKKANDTAEAAIEAQKKMSRAPTGGEVISSQERKRLEDKFLALRENIAKEDEALNLQRQKQISDLDEFYKKGIIKRDQYNANLAQIDEAHGLKMKALIQSRLEEGILTEQELLKRKHELQLQAVTDFENNRTITTQRAADLRRQIEEQYSTDVMQITSRQYSGLAGIVDTAMGSITQIVGQEGDKQFGIFKAISMATALVKGYEATVSAYAAGAKIGGPALGAVFAGVAAAGTAAIIAKLAGVGSRSSGTVSAAGASGGGADAGQEQSSPNVVISIVGDKFDRSHIASLAQGLGEYLQDGGTIRGVQVVAG